MRSDIHFSAGPASTDASGIAHHRVVCDALSSPTTVRILAPATPPPGSRLLLVLPIGHPPQTHGDGLAELQRLEVHDRYGMTIVAPEFPSRTSWFCDHPEKRGRRDESYIVGGLLGWLEGMFPCPPSQGPLLLGMSKSGWGAISLLLRHPGSFAAAACFDAPVGLQRFDRYGVDRAFGDEPTFAAHSPLELAGRRGHLLGDSPRIALLGYHLFRRDLAKLHEALVMADVPCIYSNSARREHRWHGGWLEEAVAALDAMAPAGGGPGARGEHACPPAGDRRLPARPPGHAMHHHLPSRTCAMTTSAGETPAPPPFPEPEPPVPGPDPIPDPIPDPVPPGQ